MSTFFLHSVSAVIIKLIFCNYSQWTIIIVKNSTVVLTPSSGETKHTLKPKQLMPRQSKQTKLVRASHLSSLSLALWWIDRAWATPNTGVKCPLTNLTAFMGLWHQRWRIAYPLTPGALELALRGAWVIADRSFVRQPNSTSVLLISLYPTITFNMPS